MKNLRLPNDVTVQSLTGATGYRHQLDRARRSMQRAFEFRGNDIEFQDSMWHLFQDLWHLKDWVRNDPYVPQAIKAAIVRKAETCTPLNICQDLCNGTKHLNLRSQVSGRGAIHHHIDIHFRGGQGYMDCIVDDGYGRLLSGRQIASDGLCAFIEILKSEGLGTSQLR